jgi:VanZ family protein
MTSSTERTTHRTGRALWIAACGLYTAAMFAGTHVPLKMTALHARHTDKLLHAAAYAGLGFLVGWGLCLHTRRRWTLVLAYAAILLWACVDELTQPFVGRTADVYDWLADAVGSTVGLLTAWALARWFRSPEQRATGWQSAADRLPAMESETV